MEYASGGKRTLSIDQSSFECVLFVYRWSIWLLGGTRTYEGERSPIQISSSKFERSNEGSLNEPNWAISQAIYTKDIDDVVFYALVMINRLFPSERKRIAND